MRELANVTFESGFPSNWSDPGGDATFDDGVLRSERKSLPSFPLPGHGWGKLKVEVTVDPGKRGIVEFGNGRTNLLVDFRTYRHRVVAQGAATLALRKQAIVAKRNGVYLLSFEFDHGCWRATVDGVEVIACELPNPAALTGNVGLSLWSGCTVHRVHTFGDAALDAPLHAYPPRRRDDFHLEVTVDFPDDLSYAPYTLEMLDELFAEYARWGVRRCHWIYDGIDAYNWWQFFTGSTYENYTQTLENFGDEILPTAVRAAHAHGIELYGMFKPFEMGYMLHTYGEGTENAKKFGRFSRIGGVIYRCPDYAVEHRELMTRRKPGAHGDAVNDVFTTVELVSDDDRPVGFAAEEVRVFVSDDNNTYRLYEGSIQFDDLVEERPIYEHASSGPRATDQVRRCRVLRLSNLEIRNRYFVLVAPSATSTLGNTLSDLIHVYGPKGEEPRMTLGIVPRAGQLTYDIVTATSSDSQGLDFCQRGVEFDNIEGSPTACLTGYDAMREVHIFDAGHQFIAVARGKEETSVAVASPSMEGTRSWWLSWVRDILESGADGVELRVRNHHTHMAWGEFGFEQAVRDAYLARHGVDIWTTDDFDVAQWRRLRGEAYTQFYREVRQLVDSYGKQLGMHISRSMDIEPEHGATMGIHSDWRTWLREGLADSVTMKEVFPKTPFAEEILAEARPLGVPLIFSPFANNLWRKPAGVQVCADRIRDAREGGYDGFQLYESCCVMRAHPGGRLILEQPALRDMFKANFT